MAADGARHPDAEAVRRFFMEAGGDVYYFPPGGEPVLANATPLAQALRDVVRFLRRFVVFQHPAHAHVVALWVAHTHAIEHAEATMYLAVTSPEKESGKTRVLEVLQLLVKDPWMVTEPSTAVLFRKLELGVTLLLDEVDAVFAGRDETAQQIRGVLNAGNRQGGTVARALDFGRDLHDFPVFGAKALAGIGSVPETLASRSIPVPMQRRKRGEVVGRLIVRDVGPVAEELRDRLRDALEPHAEALAAYRLGDPPDELGDRQVEGWEPLYAIAEAAGGRWPGITRRGSVAVHAGAEEDEESTGLLLLQHVRDAFDEEGHPRLFTKDLLTYLRNREDGPWARWWPEDLNDADDLKAASGLASELRRHRIQSRKVRVGVATAKGYRREDFDDAWERYLDKVPHQ